MQSPRDAAHLLQPAGLGECLVECRLPLGQQLLLLRDDRRLELCLGLGRPELPLQPLDDLVALGHLASGRVQALFARVECPLELQQGVLKDPGETARPSAPAPRKQSGRSQAGRATVPRSIGENPRHQTARRGCHRYSAQATQLPVALPPGLASCSAQPPRAAPCSLPGAPAGPQAAAPGR